MQFTEKTIKILEFDKIRAMLADCALTDGAKELAMSLVPCEHIATVLKTQRHTSDAKRLLDVKGMPSFGMIKNMEEICERAEKGAVFSARELLDIANVLRTSRSLIDYINTNKLFDTSIDEIFLRLIPNKKMEDSILRAIIAEDLVADEASAELANIRRKKKNTNNNNF